MRITSLVAAGPVALVLAVGLALSAAAQDDAELPACDPSTNAVAPCRLAAWPADGPATLPTVFGTPELGGSVWVPDTEGDAPPGGLDILGVGIARVPVRDASRLRRADDVLRSGNRRQAIRAGESLLIRTVLASAPDAIADGHAGVFVATDVDGVLSNDAPGGVEDPDGPFAGLQEVFSFNVAAGDDPDLLYSDLSRGWYRGREAFAAHRPAPEVVDVLVRPERFGEDLRVVTFADGTEGGGYDVVAIGPTLARIPIDGVAQPAPTCLEAAVGTQPFVVARLIENGQTFRDIETARSWSATATFVVTDAERAAIEARIAAGDTDQDGSTDLAGEAVLVEEGLNVRQTPRLRLGLLDGQARLDVDLGLARRGFIVLRDLAIEPTGDATVDAFLSRAADALTSAVPPFRVARRGGPIVVSAAGACVPVAAPAST